MSMKIEEFEDYLKNTHKVSPKCLDSQCDDEVLLTISRSLGNWRTLAPYFKTDVGAIDQNLTLSEEGKRLAMLTQWKTSNALKATYRNLVSTFLKAQNAALAQKVCDVVAKGGGKING